MKLEFFPIDVDSIDKEGRSIIRIFGKTPEGESVCVIDESYRPYFHVVVDSDNIKKFLDKIKKIKIPEGDKIITVHDACIEKKIYIGKEVIAIRVEVDAISDIYPISSEIKDLDRNSHRVGLDIPFQRRYLADKEIVPLKLYVVDGKELKSNFDMDLILAESIAPGKEVFLEEPRTLAFDIECYNSKRVPNEEVDPVIIISLYGDKNYKKVLTWKKSKKMKDYVEVLSGEAEMIERFKEEIREYKPDCLVGYFSDGFDFPYLKTRASKYGIKLDLGLDYSGIRMNKRGEMKTVLITGIAHIDVFRFIRGALATGIKSDSFSLDNISKELLNENKKDVNIENLHTVWDACSDKLADFCEYCLQDSRLAYKLFKKVLPNINEFVKIVAQPPAIVTRMSFGQMVEWHLIRCANKYNQLVPGRPFYDEITKRRMESYIGAFVYEPEPGLYENLAVFDFRSLYPSIITSYNIDPGTITTNREDSYETPVVDSSNEEVKYYFCRKPEGFIPLVLSEIIERRNKVKKLLKKQNKKDPVMVARLEALKVLVNSFYGYLGFSGSRWYSNECAAAITAYGRDYIKKTMESAEKFGFRGIYGDTDSVMVALEDKSKEDALKFLREFNKRLPGLMELELEDFYPRGIFVSKKSEKKGAKKKYALINKKGELKIIGFETIRGDWSLIAKEVQLKVIQEILEGKDVTKTVRYVEDIIKNIRERKVEIEKMVIVKQLRKDISDYENVGPHVEVAKRLKELGYYVGPGSTISYVVAEGSGMVRERAKLLEEAKDYDVEYYVKNQIIPAVIPILEVFGVKEEDLKEDHKQRRLGEY